jgi:hypothetical protein
LPAPARRMVPEKSARGPSDVDVLMRFSVIPAEQRRQVYAVCASLTAHAALE